MNMSERWTLARRTLLHSALSSAFLPTSSSAFAEMLGYPRSLEGPMIGAPGPTFFTVWVRASGGFPVQLEYSESRTFSSFTTSRPVSATAETDFCVVLRAEGLKPATRYYYRLRFAGELDRHQPLPFQTKTAPAGPANFRVAFGSCCRLQLDRDQRIFDTVRALEPDLFLWLGDNIYADSDQPSALADLYRRQRATPSLEPLLRSTPQLAIWDDHDFGYNDSDRLSPFKAQSLNLFKSYWANPSYGQSQQPGVYFTQAYGGVDFFFLDGRYYRDPADAPDLPGKTMLGTAQKSWLKTVLKASRAPFKILVSGGGWSSAEKSDGGDSWGVYLNERTELFNFIRDEKIGGVVCISGDSHMGELNCIPRSAEGGYDIYDFCSSPLAQMPAMRQLRQVPEMRIRDVWSRSVNVGVLDFEMGPSPKVTMTLHDVIGDAVWDPLVLTTDDLRNGVSSWARLADPNELKRLERHKRGAGYYGIDPG
jgi:alkaline phosphatase D